MMKKTSNVSFSKLSNFTALTGRVVVIGSSGFVGHEVLNLLSATGINILGVGRSDVDLVSPMAKSYFEKVISDGDTVVFTAADVPVKSLHQFENNLLMLNYFLEGTRGKRLKHLIYISSDGVFADSEKPLHEHSLRGSQNLHGLMHTVREITLESSSFQDVLCIVRPTIIYGARDPHNSYGPCLFMRLALKNEDIVLFGKGEERRDFIHVTDVAKIITEVAQMGIVGSLNAVSGEVHSFFELAHLILEITKSKVNIVSKPRNGKMPHDGYRPFDTSNLCLALPLFSQNSIKMGMELMYQGR